MKPDIEKWLKKDGKIFIKEVGVEKGQTVLDFGCGSGHYALPAVKIVGRKGHVYAVDKRKKSLDELARIARSEGLKNIKLIKTSGKLKVALADQSVDVVLLYDVLHSRYFKSAGRRKLFKEIYRVSKANALISVYPKHMKLPGVIKEPKRMSFHLERKSRKRLVHDESFDKGYVLNFRKA